MFAQGSCRIQQPLPRPDDACVSGAKVLLRSIADRPHSLLHRCVLGPYAGDSGEEFLSLEPAIDRESPLVRELRAPGGVSWDRWRGLERINRRMEPLKALAGIPHDIDLLLG